MKYVITMTELSTLTKKTRPTINHYLESYESGELDKFPFSFIKLFEMLKDSKTTKKQIVKYCQETFIDITDDVMLNEVIKILKDNKDKIDLKLLKETLLEELNDDK